MSTPEYEFESSLEPTNSSIENSSVTYWECMAEHFSRAWDLICNSYFIIQDWVYDACTCIACCDYGEEEFPKYKNVPQKRATTKGAIRITQSQSHVPPTSQPQQSSTIINIAPQSDSPRKVHSTLPQASSGNQHSVSAMANVNARSNVELSREMLPVPKVFEPPKIDFIETGSIFGDRRRIGAEQTLQMENGRFRSPGMSKTIMGPNGRQIRVSFVTGFPSIKSIESTRSTISRANKRSNETIQSLPPQQQERGNQEKVIKVTSNKSFKSSKSLLSATDSDKNNILSIDDIDNK